MKQTPEIGNTKDQRGLVVATCRGCAKTEVLSLGYEGFELPALWLYDGDAVWCSPECKKAHETEPKR